MQDDKYKKHVDSKSEIQKEIPQDKHADWVLAIWSPKGEPQAKEEGDSIKEPVARPKKKNGRGKIASTYA